MNAASAPQRNVTAIPSDLFNEEMQDDIDLSLAATVAEAAATKPMAISRLVAAAIDGDDGNGNGNGRSNTS